MKKHCFFTLFTLFTCFPLECLSYGSADASRTVREFYSCLEKIASDKDKEINSQTAEALNNSLSMCIDKEVEFPNEFKVFSFGSLGDFAEFKDDSFLRAETYISLIRKMAIVNREMVRYKVITISRVESSEEIHMSKNENYKNFYNVYVTKQIVVGNVRKEFEDIVTVYAPTNKIVTIANETGGGDPSGVNIMSLRSKAAKLFSQKRYDEAFDMYLKIVNVDSKQGDAYYRLALMAYHKLGCKKRYSSGKIRREKAIEFIDKAIKCGNYEISDYARKARYYMLNSSV